MIQRVGFLHYLSEGTYREICRMLGLDAEDRRGLDNYVTYENDRITKVQLFNLVYQDFGHVWFMHVDVNFSRFECTYEAFPAKLYEAYRALFGEDVVSGFPAYDGLNCDYVEYYTLFPVDDASACLSELQERYPREQTEKALWDHFKKPHATIAFCMARLDDTHMETLARCHGSALKKRVKDKALHRVTGVTPSIAVNAETEKEITDWLWRRHV